MAKAIEFILNAVRQLKLTAKDMGSHLIIPSSKNIAQMSKMNSSEFICAIYSFPKNNKYLLPSTLVDGTIMQQLRL